MADRTDAEQIARRIVPGQMAAAIAVVAVALLWAWVRGPFAQDLAYHDFADQRPLLGIPHCLNVLSNAPFLLVGAAGLAVLLDPRSCRPGGPFRTPVECRPFVAFFLGVGLTAVGSAYYHLDPTNARLVWDRLPMAVAFMALLAAVLDDRLGPPTGTQLLPFLVLAGLASVWYWDWTERHGAGDLRPYYLTQYGTMLALAVLLLVFPPRYSGPGWLFVALAWYLVAKVCEYPFDAAIYSHAGCVSGHTLKHLTAAAATACVLQWMRLRTPIAPRPPAEERSIR
ncbi:MAG: hypothetical protein U0746_08105 [Gemmataceae bacterium]